MKIPPANRSSFGLKFRHHDRGTAVIVVMALIAIVLIFMAGNLRTIRNLDRDVKLLERAQNRRLQPSIPAAHSPSAATNAQSDTR
jgi:hypothetical protein